MNHDVLRAICVSLVALTAVAVGGCGGGPTRFELNTEGREPGSIGRAQREAIRDTMTELFGTPDEPRVPPGVGLDVALLRRAAGPVYSDESGVGFGLYRKHCATCHAINGGGTGPSAAVLGPYPRDFRPGIFKFTSTAAGAKPTVDDLLRNLQRGNPGTAMPSFAKLDEREQAALVEYVRYLALRGETEIYVIALVVDEEEYLPLDIDWVVEDSVEPFWAMWEEASAFAVDPPPPPELPSLEAWNASVERGRELYLSEHGRCTDCHGPDGYGDGPQNPLYDDWNRPKVGVNPTETRALARLFTLPPQVLPARNFHDERFRGGDHPIDVYWRVCVGIKGTPMPASGPSPGVPGPLKPEEIWDVVNFVRQMAGKRGG